MISGSTPSDDALDSTKSTRTDKPMILIVILTTLVALIWARLATRSIQLAKQSPRLTQWDSIDWFDSELPYVIAVVPAHNEELGVEETIRGILSQDWPPEKLQLIVVDDQSTDHTSQVIRELNESEGFASQLTLLSGASRPAGWAGKTWAVHQGVASADPSTPWIWMVDSDMRLAPKALKVAYTQADKTGADLVSLTAGVETTTVAQRSTALAMIHLLWQLYPLPHVGNKLRPEALAHGAFVLIKREMYDKIGGMEALRQEIIEDIRLAQRVKAAGGLLAVRAAPTLTRTDFYGSLSDILNGLRKNAYAGMDYMPHKFWTGLVFGILFTWLPAISWLEAMALLIFQGNSWFAISLWYVGLMGLIFQAQSLMPIVIYLDLPKYYALSLPVGGSIYMWACCLSYWDFVRGKVVWRGRDFQVDALHSSQNQEPLK